MRCEKTAWVIRRSRVEFAKWGEEFFGLAKAIDVALDDGAPQKAIAAVLQRNVQPNHEKAMELADYLLAISDRVDGLSDETALSGPDEI
jgi:hypothetical protein